MSSILKPPKGHFNVLYFATASSFTGKEHEALAAPLAVGQLFRVLEEKYPGIKGKVLDSCTVTVNLDYVDIEESDAIIKEGDEVAVIPPVSSG